MLTKAHIFDQIMRCQPLTRISLDTIFKFVLTTELTTRAKRNGGFIVHFPWQLKSLKGYEVWITDLGLNKATAIISHLKGTLQKQWHFGDFWLYFYANGRKYESSQLHHVKVSRFRTFQWFPTGFKSKIWSPFIQVSWACRKGAATCLIFLLIGYAPATMDIIIPVTGTNLSHFHLLTFALWGSFLLRYPSPLFTYIL